jgi:hypothetical protein
MEHTDHTESESRVLYLQFRVVRAPIQLKDSVQDLNPVITHRFIRFQYTHPKSCGLPPSLCRRSVHSVTRAFIGLA